MGKHRKLTTIDIGCSLRNPPIGNSDNGVLLSALAWKSKKHKKLFNIVLEVDFDVYLDSLGIQNNTDKNIFIHYSLKDHWRCFKDTFDNDEMFLIIESKNILLLEENENECTPI